MKYRGIELFVRVCAESKTQEEAAARLGISLKKFHGRLHTYNHRLRNNGYDSIKNLPSGPGGKSLQVALGRLEAEGLIKRTK